MYDRRHLGVVGVLALLGSLSSASQAHPGIGRSQIILVAFHFGLLVCSGKVPVKDGRLLGGDHCLDIQI